MPENNKPDAAEAKAKAKKTSARTEKKTESAELPEFKALVTDPESANPKKRPITQSGSVIYYGSPEASHIVRMTTIFTKDVGDVKVPAMVNVKLLVNTPGVHPDAMKVLNEVNRDGLSTALEIAEAWLTQVGC